MTSDLKQVIDARIRKLQHLRELAEDPEVMSLLRDHLVGAHGNGHKPTDVRPSLIPSGDASDVRPRRGDQLRMVEETLAEATEPLDTDQIVARMQSKGFVFAAAIPKVAVNECLRQLEKRGRAEMAGKKGLSNLWRARTKAA